MMTHMNTMQLENQTVCHYIEVMHLHSRPFKTMNFMLLKRWEKQKSVDAKKQAAYRLISRSKTSRWPQTQACTCAHYYHYHAQTSMQGYIQFHSELNGVASRWKPYVPVWNLCYVTRDRDKLLKSHEIPMYRWKTSSISRSILGPSDAIVKTRMARHQTCMHYKYENNMEQMSTQQKKQKSVTIITIIIDDPQHPHKRRPKCATDDVDTVGSTSAVTMGASLARPGRVRMQHEGTATGDTWESGVFTLNCILYNNWTELKSSMPALPFLPPCIVDMKKLSTRVIDPSKSWSKMV